MEEVKKLTKKILKKDFIEYAPFLTEEEIEEDVEAAVLTFIPTELDTDFALAFEAQKKLYARICEKIRMENKKLESKKSIDLQITFLENCKKYVRILCKKSMPPREFNTLQYEKFMEEIIGEYNGEKALLSVVMESFPQKYESPKVYQKIS
ncbi:MAG: hypothetical protein PHN72_00925 [Bacilli bacterium]|nr:hypothetical protein [Bacilli bacterium]